ncbi:hypothetical protein [Salmonella enterica]|uniref:hypothetical protein n=1 Tax=Salmonella enterica TaxID=28901 RepID=UPI0009ACBA12|nr:hypothetical protein [Salmonella enterica]
MIMNAQYNKNLELTVMCNELKHVIKKHVGETVDVSIRITNKHDGSKALNIKMGKISQIDIFFIKNI